MSNLFFINCLECGKTTFRTNKSEALRPNWLYCSKTCRMKQTNRLTNPAKTTAVKIKLSRFAKKRGVAHMLTPESRRKQAKTISGSGHWNWQGGKTPTAQKIRNSLETKNWRRAVYERDNYTCQLCNTRGGTLNADHIKPFALFPDLRFDVNNGRTLCVECHKKTPTYMRRMKNYVPANTG